MSENGVGIDIKDVEKSFDGGLKALKKITLQIPPGQFLTFLGPSGCGKSTLLRLIADLIKPDQGQITLSGEKPKIGFVFQEAQLLPWKNVLNNVLLSFRIQGEVNSQTEASARDVLKRVHIADAEDLYPNQLSGGMKMRASIARALVTRPNLLLLDEPFAALDEIVRQDLGDQLRQLWRDLKMTVVFVTHSISESVYLSDRVVMLSPRPGQVILDRKINLPEQRTAELRMTPEFAQEIKSLSDVLRRGETR